ncbi:MAG: hypothetical protein Q8M03_04200 [Legionella sp.]|nr:hypothetical protein [Legionella sp.]
MAGIATKVQLFNAAYKLAWDQLIASSQQYPQMASRLRDNIVVLMKAGNDDPAEIAAEAVRSMQQP